MVPIKGCKVYQHCKDSIAHGILRVIPPADNFYDLFGGGGSVTETALTFVENGIFGEIKKWKNLHFNEINTGLCELNKAVWNGTFDFEKARKTWISRERFFAEKDLPTAWGAYVRFIWSFGNDGDSYIYSKEIELAKQLIHFFIINDNPYLPNTTENERRLFFQRIIKSNVKKKIKLKGIESLQRIMNIQHTQNHLRMHKIQNLDKVTITNKDYHEVEIKPNSVAYCDIPYNNDGSQDYGIEFSDDDFHQWAATRDFPVYFSEYKAPSEFECVWEKEVNCRLSKKDGKGIYRTEKLFFNGRKNQ
jgi:hypothetical protein